MTSERRTGFIFYRIGDDGEWEQFRTTERPPYRAARQAIDMVADALVRTKDMAHAEREIELERVLAVVERI